MEWGESFFNVCSWVLRVPLPIVQFALLMGITEMIAKIFKLYICCDVQHQNLGILVREEKVQSTSF